jgi:hypothetical protein
VVTVSVSSAITISLKMIRPPDSLQRLRDHPLVAATEVNVEQDWINHISGSTLPSLQEVLRLASFAARATTRAFSWEAANRADQVRVFLGNISPMTPADENDSTPEPLIEKAEFESFIAVSLKTLHGSQKRRAELSHLAVLKATSRRMETAESTYLRLFSGLESVLLHYREQEDLVFTCHNNPWKKLEQALRQCVDDNAALFASDFYREAAKEAIPGIRRVAAGRAFAKFTDTYGVTVSDLWPVFESTDGPTLASIRNHLIHGDLNIDSRFEAFGIALYHLEALVERCCLAILGWDWRKSEVSERLLRQRTGFDKNSLATAIADMKQRRN